MRSIWKRLRTAWDLWSHFDTAANLPYWYSAAKLAIASISGLGLGGWTARVTHWPLPVVFTVGLFGCGSVMLIFNQFAIRRLTLPAQRHGTVLESLGIEFYPDRARLAARHPLLPTLQSANEVWAWFSVGTAVRSGDAVRHQRIKRLLLASPTDPSFPLLAKAVNRTTEDLATQIRYLTQEAQAAGVAVKWCDGLTGDSLLIGNPESVSGWAQVETFIPGVVQTDRPSFRVQRQDQDGLFATLKAAYVLAWDRAVDPPQAGPAKSEPFSKTQQLVQTTKRLVINAASYGFGDRWFDATSAVKGLIVNDRISVPKLTNAVLGCDGSKDPFPHQRKVLRISYTVEGVERTVAIPEKSTLQLP